MPYPTTLDEIGKSYGTDKSSAFHDYLCFYEEKLSHLRDQAFTMIEIGVLDGGSLKTWGEYFPKATIVGLDITHATTQYAGDNRHVVIADATRGETADQVVEQFGRPLIILDDGSHIWQHQIETLRYLWPKLLNGGIFIIEDRHTSFLGVTEKDAAFKGLGIISGYDYLMKLNRQVVGREYMGSEKPFDGFVENYAGSIRSMEWYRRTCVMHKFE